MSATLPRTHRSLRDEGVSPVIGTVLILVIMILSIAGILGWGVPAIQGLQDRAEFQHALTQFLQLDSQVRNLRDPQNTRVVTIALAQGTLTFDEGDRWVISAAQSAAFNAFSIGGYEGDSPASITVDGIGLGGTEISIDKVSGGTFTNVHSCSLTCTNPLSLGTAPAPTADLDTDVVRVTVESGGTVQAEAWILNVGRISYRQTELNELNQLHFSMGAVFSQQNDAFFLEEIPTIKDPDYTISPVDTNLFVRALQLTGQDARVGGEGRFPMTFNLVDNYGASRGRPSFEDASMVRVQVSGDLRVPFCNLLEQREWVNQDSSGAAADCPDADDPATDIVSVQYTADPLGASPDPDVLTFDLSHAVVTTTVRTL